MQLVQFCCMAVFSRVRMPKCFSLHAQLLRAHRFQLAQLEAHSTAIPEHGGLLLQRPQVGCELPLLIARPGPPVYQLNSTNLLS
ncbi:hypothetical protein GOP47_0010553 [Adiantum capillus-veneris]|uniref:Uncharacterized protein n=1 Tax=Adiantum capillus-veneris TaxID=13818 RepID=A0A9D4UW89_ADICA|nr:hypothetical protein GOP47_0010553 [Adiantum capillus-veneris]